MRGPLAWRPLAALAAGHVLLALACALSLSPALAAAPPLVSPPQPTAVPTPTAARGLRLTDLPPGFQQRSLLRQQLVLADRLVEAEVATYERETTLANLLAGPTTILSVLVELASTEEARAVWPLLEAALRRGEAVEAAPAPPGLGDESAAYRITRSTQGFSLTGQVIAWRRSATLAVVEVVGLSELNDGAEAQRLAALLDGRIGTLLRG